ncbi:MAG: hypothetical protein AB7F71_25030, partial [Burkholderiaceae bacterium]
MLNIPSLRVLWRSALVACAVGLSACGSGGGNDGEVPIDPGQPPAAAAPAIVTQPASLTVAAGQPASFSVTATGEAPLNYQWQRQGVNLPGANGASLDLP